MPRQDPDVGLSQVARRPSRGPRPARANSMSDRKHPLTDLCGGRFGIVPAAVSDSPDVQNGPFRLYTILCARAKPNGTCEICLKDIAKMVGQRREEHLGAGP